MANLSILTTLVTSIYNAEVLAQEEARRWTEDGEELLVGYKFPDMKKAYYLLALNDTRLLTKEQYEFHAAYREYPFPNLRVIVFKDKEGVIGYRITNGIAGALDNLFDSWMNWED